MAAQRVVDLGTVFVASAGNSGNQPVGGSAYIAGTPANARGVISVAASIDQFDAQTIDRRTAPPTDLPDRRDHGPPGLGGGLPAGGLTDRPVRRPRGRPAGRPGNETPADAQFCYPLPAGSLDGKTVLVFKGSTGAGDCAGSTKAFNAQEAGAGAVILISLFGGAPTALGTDGETDQIPAVMISGNDGYAILDELSPAPPRATTRAPSTRRSTTTSRRSRRYTDAMTDFTSEGPARLTNDLKPDISAPGFDIQSTDVGTGNEGVSSPAPRWPPRTSPAWPSLLRAAPSRAGAPEQIKAVMMNQANQNLKDNLLGAPVPATVMGAGRVRGRSSPRRPSRWPSPGSLSYGLDADSGAGPEVAARSR